MILSFPARLRTLALERPDAPAITCAGETVTRAELESRGTRLARELQSYGVGVGDFVTVAHSQLGRLVRGVPRGVEARCDSAAGVGEIAGPRARRRSSISPDRRSSSARPTRRSTTCPTRSSTSRSVTSRRPSSRTTHSPTRVSPAWKAPTSGGSTGRPKLIVSGDPADVRHRCPWPSSACRDDGCMLVPGPLYHNGPAVWCVPGAAARQPSWCCCNGSTPRQVLAAIERHGVDVVYLVPTMMKRILRLDDDVRSATTCRRCGSCGTSPSPARRGSRRRGSTGSARSASIELYARHRGAGGRDHHRHRVARAPRFGRSA